MPPPKQAVDLFMILSGFLMMLSCEGQARGWVNFYARRFFRIAPGYYLSLLVLGLLLTAHTDGYRTFIALNPEAWKGFGDRVNVVLDLQNLLLHVSFLFGLFPKHSASTLLPDWSLSLEMQFYAVFPLLFLLTQRSRAALWVLGLICVVLTLGYDWGIEAGRFVRFREPSLLVMKLPMFIAGMLIYRARVDGMLALLFAALLLIAATHAHTSTLFAGLISVMMFVWLSPWSLSKLTGSRFVIFASDCSYSVYLFHGFILSIVGSRVLVHLLDAGWQRAPAVMVMTFVVIGLTYPLSYLVFRVVERPGINLGRAMMNARSGKFALAA